MLMLYVYILFLSFYLVNIMSINEECIYNVWTHSSEEDDENKKVYRPKSYDLPPSRGRDGFEIKQNDEIILYNIAPTDGHERIFGHFKIIEPNKLHIELSNSNMTYDMTILSCKKDLLEIQKK
jgi:hypothetical protein